MQTPTAVSGPKHCPGAEGEAVDTDGGGGNADVGKLLGGADGDSGGDGAEDGNGPFPTCIEKLDGRWQGYTCDFLANAGLGTPNPYCRYLSIKSKCAMCGVCVKP